VSDRVQRASGRDVGIVGGGLLGMTVAYRLAKAGVRVTVYERGQRLGGLAGTTDLGGRRVDRYYHAVLPTDDRVRALAADVGLGEEDFRFRRLGVGFYHDGRLASMSTPRELATFPGLRARDRLRLAAFVARCQLTRDAAGLEDTTLEEWLRRAAGTALWERLWRPLLESKFDGRYDDLPATYLWSRMRRTAGTRDRAGREVMGWIRGGYETLLERMAGAIRAMGGEVHTSTLVRAVPAPAGRALGVVLERGLRPHDRVVTTQLRPGLDRLLAPALVAALGADPNRYLGVVCVVARVRRSVSPYYALNITDRRVPLTSIVETTHVVDPEHVGGRLIYVPRYVDPSSADLERPAADIRREYLGHVRTIFPGFSDEDVIASEVARAKVAEPVHRVAVAPRTAELFPAPGLVVASAAHVYPEIVNGQAIVGVADRVAAELLARLPETSSGRVAA
jgi:protoporphyrinogen oxidase